MVCAPVGSIIPELWSIIPSLKLRDYLSVQAHKQCSISHLTIIITVMIGLMYQTLLANLLINGFRFYLLASVINLYRLTACKALSMAQVTYELLNTCLDQ